MPCTKYHKFHATTSRGDKSSRGQLGEIIEVGAAKIFRETDKKMIENKEILMIDWLSNVLDVVKLAILLQNPFEESQ